MTDPAASRQPQPSGAIRGQDATAPAEHVIWRMLLRRGFAIAPEDALLVADTLRGLFQADPPARPRARDPRPGRRPTAPGAGCDPLFTEKDARGA
jgi:hypothetical protein